MTLTRQISVVLINCFAISIVSASIFYLNEPLTFNGYDGKYNFLKIALQGNWMPFQFGFGNNIFQELGNIFLSHNIYFFPGYLPGLFIQDIKLASPLIYMTHTLVGFVLTYLFSRTFESNTRHNMLCAWFMCFFSMPFFWPVMIYPITGMIPHLLQVICVIGLSISLFFSIGRNSRKSDVYRVFAIVFLMVLSTLSAPALTCLASPVVIVMGMVSVVFATQKERNRKLIALGVILIILLPSVIPVLAGTILYTVPYFFLSELYSSQGGWSSVSILFHSKTWFAGPSIFVLSLAGCIYSLIKKMGKLKAVAISTIICKVMLLSIGAFIEWSARTPSVSLVNIETFLWPFYILFCSIIFSAALKLPFFQYSKFGVIFRKYIIILPIFVSVFQSLPNANKKFWDAWLYPLKFLTICKFY